MLGKDAILKTDDGESMEEFLTRIRINRENGGSYCFDCAIMFDTVIEGRKHDFEKHYEYALAQCYGDKQKLHEWMNLKVD